MLAISRNSTASEHQIRVGIEQRPIPTIDDGRYTRRVIDPLSLQGLRRFTSILELIHTRTPITCKAARSHFCPTDK